MESIAATHRRFGTIDIFPAVITDVPKVLESAVHAAIEAVGRLGVLGLHIEGPQFPSPAGALIKRNSSALWMT